ncbi:hypothetical protein N7474_005318 [Penicillium riverlandense]|uniref:uncharacterized protein n=1 Tax=Penicillium riverlandense TaxID=1903569 RepID=UPI0025478784|nr:uncharacterized protein N7474_005318 [Penicillium riverlandense]KAJ5819727.1 hypothetical protein N7474_005318 [Penicillium riverlandense]
MKTYGRPTWRVYDDERATKKRRVHHESDEAEANLQYAIRESSAAVLSSPSRRNSVLSEATDHIDDLDDLTTPHATPLSEVNSNSVRSVTDPPKAPKAPVMRQMQIDLGNEVRKTCATCGMEYIPSNPEDAALHKKFHEMNATGVDLGKAFVKANASRWVYEATRFDEGYVVIVDRKATPSAKNQAKKVLEVVNKELSSPEIEDEVLWSQIEPPPHLQEKEGTEKVDRYRVFLHMKDSRCVGVCLTERIWESRPVASESGSDDTNSSVTVGAETHPAIVGVSRIWTSGASRRKGIALDLLDCVVSNFIYGMEISKGELAFSQPTASGKRLAHKFFEAEPTWHVYNE